MYKAVIEWPKPTDRKITMPPQFKLSMLNKCIDVVRVGQKAIECKKKILWVDVINIYISKNFLRFRLVWWSL